MSDGRECGAVLRPAVRREDRRGEGRHPSEQLIPDGWELVGLHTNNTERVSVLPLGMATEASEGAATPAVSSGKLK